MNVPVEERLQSVLVALERERWLNQPQGRRHVLVNLTDFTRASSTTARDLRTRSVVGATSVGRTARPSSRT